MGYRRVQVDGPDGIEEFSIRISDQGFNQWVAARDSLRPTGVPDRPPDVDTDTVRVWVPHPGEEELPYFIRQREQEAAGIEPILTMVWRAGPLSVRLFVTGFADGVIQLDCYQQHDGAQLAHVGEEHPADQDPNEVWEAIESLIITVDGKEGWPKLPEVTDYQDFTEMEASRELARAEVKLGFINPLPEGKA